MRWLARSTFVLVAVVTTPLAWADEPSVFEKAHDGLVDIWQTGSNDLYLPFHTYHMRFAYDQAKIDSYQENPPGIGFGRSKFRSNGDWHGIYAMGFQDSHFKPSYMVGYAYQRFWHPATDWRVGGGLTAFVMTRADIAHYTPFPGVLPMASIGYKHVSVETAYVPGKQGAGNILFFWGRIEFGR
jgi:hypothetical protein